MGSADRVVLPVPGKAEEDGDVARFADVGRAVHGEGAFLGHEVVHDREDRLLDLAVVLAAADEDHLAVEVDDDGRLGMRAVHLGDAVEAGGRHDGKVGGEVFELVFRGADEQLVVNMFLRPSQLMMRKRLAYFGSGAGKAVEHEDLAPLQIGAHAAVDALERGLFHGHVHLAPVDLIGDVGGFDGEFIVGGTAGVLAGRHDQSAGRREPALAAAERMLHELGGREVAIDRSGVDDAHLFEFCKHVSFSSRI